MKIHFSWIIYGFLTLTIVATSSCSSSDEKAEQAAAQAEALQMEGKLPEPREAARIEARKFLTKNWTDSLQLHARLLEVKALRSKYEMEGKKEQAAVFDSVFIKTLKTVNPKLAGEVEAGLAGK